MSKRHDELVELIEKCLQEIKDSNSGISYDKENKAFHISDRPAPWFFFASMIHSMANLHIYQNELKELQSKKEPDRSGLYIKIIELIRKRRLALIEQKSSFVIGESYAHGIHDAREEEISYLRRLESIIIEGI